MKFTLSWLKKFINLNPNTDINLICDTLNKIGLEVEDVIDRSKEFDNFKVGHIKNCSQHPSADKLQICSVDLGEQNLRQIVCGAQNARIGIKVVVADIGAVIPGGNFKIKASKIRDVESLGMLCSEEELGLEEHSEGIMELSASAEVGAGVSELLGFDDPVIEINVTPNRADALGVYGIARDLAAAGIGTLKEINTDLTTENNSSIKVSTNNDTYFTYCYIENITNGPSPKWLANSLKQIGVKSISAIVDITNYIAYSFGQPMHAYDADKLNGDLEVINATSAHKFEALDDKVYAIEPGDIIIKDKSQTHCLAGIIGGKHSSVSDNTKNILLEAAVFSRNSIINTARRLNIHTSSKYRFERYVDEAFTKNAINIAASLAKEICGGNVSAVEQTRDFILHKQEVVFKFSEIEKRLGICIDQNQAKVILEKLGFKIDINGEILKVVSPSWRSDISIKEDIIEELARIYGYENIKQIALPKLDQKVIYPLHKKYIEEIRRMLASKGFKEVITWSFVENELAKDYQDCSKDLYVQNPISQDLNYMRPSILIGLTKAIDANSKKNIDSLSLFEIGPVFDENFSNEVITHVTFARYGNLFKRNIHDKNRNYDIYDIKSDLEYILSSLNLTFDKLIMKPATSKYFHPTRSAGLYLGKQFLGNLGEIDPTITKKFGLSERIVAAELVFNNLPIPSHKKGLRKNFTNMKFPAVERDFAFVINRDQDVGQILSTIKILDKNLIKEVYLFDIYLGSNIDADKKSIAISVILQSDLKTLEEAEITELSKKIIDTVSNRYNGSLRA